MDAKVKTRRISELLSRRSSVAAPQVPVEELFEKLDLSPRGTLFSTFDSEQAQEALNVIKILVAEEDFNFFLYLADIVRTLKNDGFFLYVLYTSVLHRDDCRDVVLPPIEECAPHWFFAAETIHEAIQLSIHDTDEKDCMVINQKTAEAIELESRLAYFREDLSLNTHHWSWHVVFPIKWDPQATGKMKDRQGEMFYYMHQQMLSRYNSERLSNRLNRVVPLQNFREQLEGYSPHLTSQDVGVHHASRKAGLRMKDLPALRVQDLEIWRLRIIDAIDRKFVRDASLNKISLDNDNGIDILGSLVEANYSSINQSFYGNLHNRGHIILASVHDPDKRFREKIGVMGFNESAPRDPIFYRWHMYMDNLFQRHKATLRPYTREELSFEGIRIVSAEVNAEEKNVMQTFMRKNLSDLSHAHFLGPKKRILVEYEHLDHEPFTYTYQIGNNTGEEKDVTIRVFLGPKYDENGGLFSINDQRRLMIEMDKFQKKLAPGLNTIIRKNSDSSVTLPRRKQSFKMLLEGNIEPKADYCTCGWPEHLLIPKGTFTGMEFSLFVMCTDYNYDKPDLEPEKIECSGAISYCGTKDQKYPDKKPMGFPFDRPITARDMSSFLTPNMILTEVEIKFLTSVKPITGQAVTLCGGNI